MRAKEHIESANTEFLEAGCKLSFDPQSKVVSAKVGDNITEYNLPPLLQANQGAVPGWFLAGIWDDLSLPEKTDSIENSYLGGWGFYILPGTTAWYKNLPLDNSKFLIYSNNNFYVTDVEENLASNTRLPKHADLVAACPRGSIYHIIKLFEEQCWFDDQATKLPSQSIRPYRK